MFKPTLAAISVATLLSCTPPCPDLRRLRQSIMVPPLEALESWIAAREAKVPHLKAGVEAQILWAAPGTPRRTDLAIVYLPGYTATRGEIAPVPELVAAALGANLYYARLTAQGEGSDAHKTVTAKQWLRDALEAIEIGRRLGTRLVVMGTSTGGTLASILALNPPGVFADATVLVSPNFTPADTRSEMLLWPLASWIVRALLGREVDVESRSPDHGHFWDLKHDPHSLIPMMRLVQWARNSPFEAWPTPVMVVYDPHDGVVDERVTVSLMERVPPHLVTWNEWSAAPGDDHHVLAGRILSPQGTEPMVTAVVNYLRGVLGSS